MDPALQERIFRCVDWCHKAGLSVVPLGPDKRPVTKWGDSIGKPTPVERFPRNCNIAMLTGAENGICVVDCDTTEAAVAWMGRHDTATPLMVKTRRGMHFFYRHPGVYVKSNSHIPMGDTGTVYDVKGDRSYVVFPPSMSKGFQYAFLFCKENPQATILDFKTLPVFRTEWRPENSTPQGRATGISDPVRYIQLIRADSGSGGHNATYRAVCRLKDGGYSEMEALAAMIEWNKTNANPPWTHRELIHKVKSCYGK